MWYNQYTINNGPATVYSMTGILGVIHEYSGCDVIVCCGIIKSGYDAICSSYDVIHIVSFICYHTYNGGCMIDNLGVMTEIQYMCCQI